jgi:hypothetical protein
VVPQAQSLQVVRISGPTVLPLDSVIDLAPPRRTQASGKLAGSVAVLDESPQAHRWTIGRSTQIKGNSSCANREALPSWGGDGEVAGRLGIDQPVPLQESWLVGGPQKRRDWHVHNDLGCGHGRRRKGFIAHH